MRKFIFILSVLTFWHCLPAYGETPGGMALEAEKLYQGEKYQAALQQWDGLQSLGYVNGPLYFNMANAYWRMGQVGQARRYLLKAVALDPRNKAIRSNLDFVNEKLGLKIPIGEGPVAILKKIPWWRVSLNFFETLKLIAISSLLFFGYLTWKMRGKSKVNRSWAFILGGIFFLSLFLGGPKVYKYYSNHRAIVISHQAPLLKAPATEAVSGKQLKEGSEIKVLKKQGNFRFVKTDSGGEGWVEAQVLGEV